MRVKHLKLLLPHGLSGDYVENLSNQIFDYVFIMCPCIFYVQHLRLPAE